MDDDLVVGGDCDVVAVALDRQGDIVTLRPIVDEVTEQATRARTLKADLDTALSLNLVTRGEGHNLADVFRRQLVCLAYGVGDS